MVRKIIRRLSELFVYPLTSGLVAHAVGLNKLKFILFWMSKALYVSRRSMPAVQLKFKQAKFIFSCGIEIVIFDDIFLKKVYERAPGFRAQENSVIVDAGANVGIYSVHAALMNPSAKIYATEPVPATRRRLEENLSLNAISASVEIIPFALWEKDCQLFFDAYRYSPQARANVSAKGTAVNAITLDTFVDRYGIQRIDLLKLDAEFAEDNILRGGGNVAFSRISKIVLEYHSEEKRMNVEQLLKMHGFRKVLQSETILYFTRIDVPHR